MPSVTLNFGHVVIDLKLQAHNVESAGEPYLDWLRCQVRVTDGAFHALVQWNVMPVELGRLAADLVAIYDAFPKRIDTEFRPTEPNLVFTFAVGSRGQIEGRYEAHESFIDGAHLQGSFVMEQATLPGLAASIREFVASASGHAA